MQIVNSYLALMALRDAGYKSTGSALAELVDNSLEANATDISIMTFSKMDTEKIKGFYTIKAIGVLDNGHGIFPEDSMSIETITNCLSLGWGTRLEGAKGLGKFGFGLKGSSISQCRRVSVYSWKNSKTFKQVLDLDAVKENKLETLPSAVQVPFPNIIKQYVNKHPQFSKNGTFVLWEKLDKIDFKSSKTLLNRMNNDLCRIYRHFLDDDDDYGKRRNISLIDYDLDKKLKKTEVSLLPNDPLYLLTPNNVPDGDGEATNVVHDEFKIEVEYEEDKFSEITIKSSVALPEVQRKNGVQQGGTPRGKHYKKNQGISFMRAEREIDFGDFGFIDGQEINRWWGIEVRFEPALDSIFGVTNNKQHISKIKKIDPKTDADFMKDLKELSENPDNPARFRAKLQLEISSILIDQISKCMSIIKSRGGGGKSIKGKDGKVSYLTDGLTDTVNHQIRGDKTKTKAEHDDLTNEEKVQKLLDDTRELHPEESQEQIDAIVKAKKDYAVDLQKRDFPGKTFLDFKSQGGAAVAVINTRHAFYNKFYSILEKHDDDTAKEALRIILMSLIHAENKMRIKMDPEIFEEFREKWGKIVHDLLKAY